MNKESRSFIAWFAVLALALGVAYWSSRPVSENSDSKVAIVNLDQAKLSKIEFKSPDFLITASRSSDAMTRWWISVERKPKETEPSKPSPEKSAEKFIASSKFQDLIAKLSPFNALRVIGKVGADQLKEFGLQDGNKTLVVEDAAGTKILSLTIGKALYGSSNVYVMNQSDQTVLLAAGDFLSDMEKPELRVFERMISSIPFEEIQMASVSAGSKSKTFSHTKRDPKGGLIWTAEDGDGSAIAPASSWFDRVDHLRVATYATDEMQAKLLGIPASFEVKLTGLGSAVEIIQVKKVPGATEDEYWVTSDHLKWHGKVATSRADVIYKDLPQILGK